MKQASTLILVFIILAQLSCAQSSLAFRNKNWNPSTGKYFFSTMLTWSYHNELATSAQLKKGEIVIYVDEKSGTFLFTKEAYGWSGEMIDFVIVDQKGNYIIGHTDEFGGKHREHKKSEEFAEVTIQAKQILSNFKKYCLPTGNTKYFGQNNDGWPVLNGKEYIMSHQKTEDKNTIYLYTSKYNFLPVYFFNKLQLEAQLPVTFDYHLSLPSNQMLLEDTYIWNGKKSTVSFLSASPTEYFIDLHDFKKQ
jgi:hypothetical protein